MTALTRPTTIAETASRPQSIGSSRTMTLPASKRLQASNDARRHPPFTLKHNPPPVSAVILGRTPPLQIPSTQYGGVPQHQAVLPDPAASRAWAQWGYVSGRLRYWVRSSHRASTVVVLRFNDLFCEIDGHESKPSSKGRSRITTGEKPHSYRRQRTERTASEDPLSHETCTGQPD